MPHAQADVVVFPAFVDIRECLASGVQAGGQCGHALDNGAHTGDTSIAMLAAMGCKYVLCGHSERREHHHESNDAVAKQVASALRHGITPVLCVGETADQREMDETEEVIAEQLNAVKLDPKVIVAYEPVWAIGSGKTATPGDAQKVHKFIRGMLPSPDMRIVYGGSMNAKNAKELLEQPDIDGGLIGGASLKPTEFGSIVAAAVQAKK
jgi:triosephosphate isomerase